MRSFFLLALCCSNIVFASATTLEEQLKQAIYQNNSGQIQSLLYQYQQQPQQDLTLKAYAVAKLATLQQNYDVAIRIYRKILSERPELNSIRMELAKVLFADRQDSAARVQFDKVKNAGMVEIRFIGPMERKSVTVFGFHKIGKIKPYLNMKNAVFSKITRRLVISEQLQRR